MCPEPLIPTDDVMDHFEQYSLDHYMTEFYIDFTVQQVQLAECRGIEVVD